MMLNKFYVDDIIKTAINEDINYIDAATDLVIGENQRSSAKIFAKQDGVLCGIDVAARVFELLGGVEISIFNRDGDKLKNGDVIIELAGKTATLLKGERTALNLLSHMSGIATATARLVSLCEGTSASVADTRKTLPGLRALQKYAVIIGGGKNHRFNLSDAAMLKDNHIDAAGSIENAVRLLRSRAGHTIKIEVETRNADEVKQAAACGADIIMLDNMTPAQTREAVKLAGKKALLEASGNINEQNIAEYAQTGVDIISIGALTHSVSAFDFSMKIHRKR